MVSDQFASIAKQVGVSIIAAALGFGGKAAIESVNNSHELENDKALIAKLFNLQEKTQTDVQTLVVNETRLEGKVDVLGQKVDDLPQRAADATRHSK